MGLCYGTEKGKKPAMTAGYTGTKATEAPQKVHVYGADAYELVRARHPKTCVIVKQSIRFTSSSQFLRLFERPETNQGRKRHIVS